MIALSAAKPVIDGREVRDVGAGRLELAEAVRAVAAEDLGLLALLHELLGERLRVARRLRREEHDVGVARHLRDVGREVRDRVGDGLMRRGDARGLEVLLDLATEAQRVGLLEVEDHDVLDLAARRSCTWRRSSPGSRRPGRRGRTPSWPPGCRPW